jgi:hypothetical protein
MSEKWTKAEKQACRRLAKAFKAWWWCPGAETSENERALDELVESIDGVQEAVSKAELDRHASRRGFHA